MQSSSSSHYHSTNGYEDLRLPPIRNSTPYSSTPRPHTSSRYVPPMEPPAHTSSTIYPRNPSMTLPPLRHPERRPSSAMGYSSSYGGASLPPHSASRHPPSHPSPNGLPPVSSSYTRPSHHRSNSLSVNTADHEQHSAYTQAPPSTHRGSSYSNGFEATSPTSASGSRAFACDLCGAIFSRAYDCKRHREIHTRQGGHECPYCHKTLSRADALKRHMERGCSGMDEDDYDEAERDRERKRDKRHSMGGEASSSKYYHSSSKHH